MAMDGRPAPPQRLVSRIRLTLSLLFGTAIFLPSVWRPPLNATWAILHDSSLYRSSTFETFWTVFCYAAIEVPVTMLFMRHPEWRLARSAAQPQHSVKVKGMRRPSRRLMEALVYVAPLLTLDLLMIKKFADVPLEDMLQSGNYDTSMPALSGGSKHSRTFLIPSLHNMTWHSPLQTERALPKDAPTSRRLALELMCSLVLYDALFFVFHLSMHVLPVLKQWHKPHHSHGEMHPQITNQLHIVERLGLVLLANFSLNIIGSHVLTRTIFIPVFVWLLVEIHCGLDLPWGYDKVLPRGWAGGAKKHARHHREGEVGFEPYFEWCDAIWVRIRRAWTASVRSA